MMGRFLRFELIQNILMFYRRFKNKRDYRKNFIKEWS